MENIDMIYAVLGTVAVAMTVLIANKRLSKSQKPTNSDPWGGIGKGVRTSDYFYTEE
ncbi:MAG TPA: hypothetical protein HA315_02310 [Candidatus Thalassarchaeaceae archaeon]|jgi:hypothetical protein|nr:hypothetical protein [Candidatus Thalassarchaeaceae archaeon]|tara:strand:- start:289 stop:459 length:171 start_codon:yes stop_codon:yes gene_type:complete